jgi:hypothetical protein
LYKVTKSEYVQLLLEQCCPLWAHAFQKFDGGVEKAHQLSRPIWGKLQNWLTQQG